MTPTLNQMLDVVRPECKISDDYMAVPVITPIVTGGEMRSYNLRMSVILLLQTIEAELFNTCYSSENIPMDVIESNLLEVTETIPNIHSDENDVIVHAINIGNTGLHFIYCLCILNNVYCLDVFYSTDPADTIALIEKYKACTEPSN